MQFHDLGYHCFSGLFAAADVHAASVDVEAYCQKLREGHEDKNVAYISDLKPHRNPGLDIQAVRNVPFVLGELPGISKSLRELILQQGLWEIAEEVLGSREVIYHFSNVTRKPAQVGPTIAWHRDYPNEYICPMESENFFRVLIPLEGMTRENGCTEAIPRSHLISDAAASEEREKRSFSVENPIPLEADSGDAIAIHPKVLHGGRGNRSGRERNVVVVQFGLKTDNYLYRESELYTGLGRGEILA